MGFWGLNPPCCLHTVCSVLLSLCAAAVGVRLSIWVQQSLCRLVRKCLTHLALCGTAVRRWQHTVQAQPAMCGVRVCCCAMCSQAGCLS